MTSTSIAKVLPPNVIGMVVKISYGEKDHPSKNVRIVGDGVMGGESRAFQQDMDITEVVAPLSTIVWWMSFCIIVT